MYNIFFRIIQLTAEQIKKKYGDQSEEKTLPIMDVWSLHAVTDSNLSPHQVVHQSSLWGFGGAPECQLLYPPTELTDINIRFILLHLWGFFGGWRGTVFQYRQLEQKTLLFLFGYVFCSFDSILWQNHFVLDISVKKKKKKK